MAQPFLHLGLELSVVIPVSVATAIFSRSGNGSFAMASRSPESTVLNGSMFFISGFSLANSGHAVEAIHHL